LPQRTQSTQRGKRGREEVCMWQRRSQQPRHGERSASARQELALRLPTPTTKLISLANPCFAEAQRSLEGNPGFMWHSRSRL